jgi:hypothetical protein
MMNEKVFFIKNTILKIIDFFYPLFKKWMPVETFRYISCGGGVTVLGLLIFFISYNFLLTPFLQIRIINNKSVEWVNIGNLSVTRYISAYVLSLVFSFPIGFFLSKYIVFQKSHLRGRIQLFRYATLQIFNIIMNYYLLHFFVGWCKFWATPSQTMTAALLAIFSYFFQRYVSFRTNEDLSNKTISDS